ncbi:MAG: emopamil-binding protein [Mycobacterium sp.]
MTSDVESKAAADREPNLVRPWAPHRRTAYLLLSGFTGVAFVLVVVGVGTRVLPPSFTVDVIANLLFGIPVILLPLVYLWTGRGEQRPRLERAAELTMIYLPYTAGSQLGYETIFLLGHPLDLWTPTTDPGWKWLWWQYGLADTRYTSGNNWIFGLELVGVITGATLFFVWTRLMRRDLPAESRIRYLWLAFTGCAMLLSSTGVYFLSEVRSGFSDIGQGAFGLWFKFIAENVPFMILPFFVLFAIYLQIDHLTRRAGAQAVSR